MTLREFHKRAPSDEANGYRKDGSDFNKPYSQFLERLNHNRWKSKGWRWHAKSYRVNDDGKKYLMIRPLEHLTAAGKLYPNAWPLVDEFRQDRGKGLPNWPNWCFLPMSAFYAIVSADAKVERLPLKLIGDVARLSALGTWRISQGVYRFDPDLAKALIDSPYYWRHPCGCPIPTPRMVYLCRDARVQLQPANSLRILCASGVGC